MDRKRLDMQTEKNGTELTIRLSGQLNTATAKKLSDLLDEELPGVQSLTFDFEGCSYVSSVGLRVLLNTYKQLKAAKGKMLLTNVGESFMEVLDATGLDGSFDIR